METNKKMTKEEFEVVKARMIISFDLRPIVGHSDYYVDLENQDIYSFKLRKITKLQYGVAFGGYLVVNLTPDGTSKQENYYVHHVMYASFKGVRIGAWRVENKKVTLHHKDTNIKNNHYLNLIEVNSQHDAEWKRKMSEQAKGRAPKKVSDEEVIEMRQMFQDSNMPITKFATLNSKKYDIDEVTMYNILRKKTRKNIAV